MGRILGENSSFRAPMGGDSTTKADELISNSNSILLAPRLPNSQSQSPSSCAGLACSTITRPSFATVLTHFVVAFRVSTIPSLVVALPRFRHSQFDHRQLASPSHHGRDRQSYQCEDSLQQSPGLLLLDTYVFDVPPLVLSRACYRAKCSSETPTNGATERDGASQTA